MRSSGTCRQMVGAAVLCAVVWSTTARADDGVVPPFVLVRGGEPAATVVYAGEEASLKAAVQDLADYVERISGAKLRVIEGVDDTPGPTLHLGETALFGRLGDAMKKVKVDGFAMKRVGEDLVIVGAIPQGTANGITTLLQDQFGVRWYYGGPLWEVVPRRSTLAIGVTSNTGDVRVENPAFLGRHLYSGNGGAAFQRRVRLTLNGVKLPYVGTSHDLVKIINPKKFGDHPEYFAYWDGRHHVEHDVQPCLTHPDMPGIFLDYVREGNSGFGVNDNQTACRCERCMKVDGDAEPYMGMTNISESFFQLLARVAKEAKVVRPEMRLGAFAYQLTNAPPKSVDFIGDNVDIVLCQDTALNFDAAHKAMDQRMAEEWVKKCGYVRFYDYIGLSYWTPRYFPHILADQIRHIAKIGVAGYGTHSGTMIDSSMPMYYLLAQMLWDADLDADAVIDEMLTDLYGEARAPIAAFYDHWEDCWERQTNLRWLYGIDNFRGEMALYTPADFEKGKALLEEAATAAKDEIVRQRIAFLQERYAFTYESAQAFYTSMTAIRWEPTDDAEDAITLSNRVVDAWERWAKRLPQTTPLDGTSVFPWLGKPERCRIWSLKQQMRDGVIAPLVRWVCANEGRIAPADLRRIEHTLAGVAMLNRSNVERQVTEMIEAIPYPPRVDGLLVSGAVRAQSPPKLDAGPTPWAGGGFLEAAPWVFMDRATKPEIGKYQDPVAQHRTIMSVPPVFDDQSMECQASWDDRYLYLRVNVRDERHVQESTGPGMWQQDSIRVALTPQRDNFLYDVHSWTYIWGGYRGCELEFGVALKGDKAELHVEKTPEGLPSDVTPATGIRVAAARHRSHTIYEAAIDWRLIPDFEPKAEKSVGFWLSVNDTDKGELVTAEYGSSINRVKRPTGFSAIRLAGE